MAISNFLYSYVIRSYDQADLSYCEEWVTNRMVRASGAINKKYN